MYHAGANPSLSPDDSKEQLQRRFADIVFQFHSYVECIIRTLAADFKEPHDLREYLLTLDAFSHSEEHGISLVYSSVSKFQTAKHVKDVVQVLVLEYCSFLNCDIFEMIVKHYGSDTGQNEMKYPNLLKAFVDRHSIGDLIQVKPLIGTDVDILMRKIMLKVNIDLSCKLSTLVEMRRQLARILGITPAGLRLIAVEGDCIITFQVLGSLAGQIFNGDKASILTQEKMWKLQGLLIQWLKCGGYEWDFTGDIPGNFTRNKMHHYMQSMFYSCI